MKGRCGVTCHDKDVGTPRQTIQIKRGGMGKASGEGPQGWKLRPARLLSRSLAEMAVKYRKTKR
jgi:hypothetical protein